MSDIHTSAGSDKTGTPALGIADWLCLAAAPTFALMALLSCLQGSEASMSCMGASPLTGMAAMYLLMSAFHLAPWLRAISGRPVQRDLR
jgi:hypothetical protein